MSKRDEALQLAREGVEIHSPNMPEYKVCAALIEALAELAGQKRPQNCGTGHCSCIECVMEPTEVWRDDDPPKRGTYRVRRIGTASTNYGYAYWTGKGWGSICATWKWAQESKGLGRKTPSRYPMQWLKKTARRIEGDK